MTASIIPSSLSEPEDSNPDVVDYMGKLSRAVFYQYRQTPRYQEAWHEFFKQWSGDPKAPLLIRRSSPLWIDERPDCSIIFCDNSPAHWAMSKAFDDPPPPKFTLEIAWDLVRSEIPIFATISAKERAEIEKDFSAYREIKALWKEKKYNLADKNWRVDHIKNVGVKMRGDDFASLPRNKLKPFFLRLVSPVNITLTPKKLAGVGDMKEYLNLLQAERQRFMPDFGDD
jgi:hypothetical protein